MTDGEIEKLRDDIKRLSEHVSNLQRAVMWLCKDIPATGYAVLPNGDKVRSLVSHLVEDHASAEKRVAWYRVPKNESPCDGRDPECP